eukprot:scaffold108_cov162-Amphora_coffeaeformis.AAC.23
MSGRLKILGKKSYCPWKADNIARVRRDEQAQQERQRREHEREATAVREKRWAALGGRQPNPLSGHPRSSHVNLFAKEEQDAVLLKTAPEKTTTATTQGKRPKSDEVPFYLKTDPFASGERDNKLESQERQRRKNLDPMSRYHPDQCERIVDDSMIGSNKNEGNTKKPSHGRRKRRSSESVSDCSSTKSDDEDGNSQSRRSKRKRRKHKKKRPRDQKKERQFHTSSISMQELRQKRIERERQEKERQLQLIGGK